MAEKRKKKFKKSLRQSTHPIPPEKVEESKVKYDRRRSKQEAEKEVKEDLLKHRRQ